LQKFVQDETALFDDDSGRGQVERVEIGRTAGGVHHEIGFRRNLLAPGAGAHTEAAAHVIDRLDDRAGSHLDADFGELLHEPADELGLKAREHALGPLQHDHFGAGARGDMRELRRDVAAADHGDARGELIELEEPIAGDQMLDTGKRERYRTREGGDQHMPGLNALPVDLDRSLSGKAHLAVKGIDAPFREAMFLLLRDGIGEGA
jgi:hypothetical protein